MNAQTALETNTLPATAGVPATMKAFIVDKFGKNEKVRFGEWPMPIIGDSDVLVQVHAAGVNLLDAKIRDGEFKPILPYRPPYVAGHDLAGTIVEVGKNSRRFKVGDEVYARPRDGRGGTFAEFIAVNETDVALKPANLSFEEAASIPLVGLTAWQALVERAKLTRGQKVFIQAGSGGVGTFAIQLAKHLGATVATTTSAGNAGLVSALGADVVIDYASQDFGNVLSDYDVVLNSQDQKSLERSLQVLKPGGVVISISGPPDPDFATEKGLNPVLKLVFRALSSRIRRLARRAKVRFAFMFMASNGSQLDIITSLVEAGVVRPVIDRVFPLEATNDALDFVEKGRAKGKVVIKIR